MALDNWLNDDNQNTRRHQELVNAVNEAHHTNVDGDTESFHTPGGRSLVDRRPLRFADRRIARVIPPESSGYTYTDARYRLQIMVQEPSGDYSGSPPDVGDNVRLKPEDRPSMFPAGGDNGYDPTDTAHYATGERITAINVAELTGPGISNPNLDSAAGSHNIVEDGKLYVEVLCVFDQESPSQPHWFFLHKAEQGPQYQFQVHTGVSQNQKGWDFVRAHGM